MSVYNDIIEFLFTRLTTDAAIKASMGTTVRLYNLETIKDAKFPYLVHRLDMDLANSHVVQDGSYFIDIWDHATTKTLVWNVRDRIITLLDLFKFSTASNKACRMNYTSDGLIPESTNLTVQKTKKNIVHLAMIFDIRCDRFGEIKEIVNR